MWSDIFNWVLDFLSNIGNFANWLFTPININIAASNLSEFYNDMNRLGLSNVPTWLYDFLAKTTEPINVAPIGLLSLGFISVVLAWYVIKFFTK